MAPYPPLILDLTEDERLEVVRFLSLDAYERGPTSLLNRSAADGSQHLPAPSGRYCSGEVGLAEWAKDWRFTHEGALSAQLLEFERGARQIMAEDTSFGEYQQRVVGLAKETLPLETVEDAMREASPWVARDLASALAFQAEQTEAAVLIEAALLAATILGERGLDELSDLTSLRGLSERTGRKNVERTVLVWNEKHETSTPKLAGSPAIIMVGTPFCGFCRNALTAIQSDTELTAAMQTSALLLSPPGESLDGAAHGQWRRRFPTFPYAAAIRRSDWVELSFSRTPVFYVEREGELELLFVGWPSDESKERIGLLRNELLKLNED
jgi:hypothetical protein